ncbi:hypothetical protein Pan189_12530 [Stratiformator vulcanicus]|uniref:AAA domain-containing protein n=1 Tax=Stratiformator vulcanicus TaxID=2527980 RepID=A0A517QZ15_9PLAN|nr:hypothetical protein Pan189_12530 [Stratiformator vulcanicus]
MQRSGLRCVRTRHPCSRTVSMPRGRPGGCVVGHVAERQDASRVAFEIFTYLTPLFDTVPYIRLAGERGSGKTKMLTWLKKRCFRGHHPGASSNPALFRRLDRDSCTLLFDQAEFLSKIERISADERITIFLSGSSRSGSLVDRCSDGDGYEPESYSVFGPKVFASISAPRDSALLSRLITIPMRRSRGKD